MPTEISPLTGAIGAEVRGVDLKRPLDGVTFDTLHRAFLAHCVLVFRDQHIDENAQLGFARHWGEPYETPLLKYVPGFPALLRLTNPTKEYTSTETWHYDAPHAAVPPKITVLSARVIPLGGDTMWCNQYLAYERLSPGMQRMLAGVRARFRATRLARYLRADADDVPSAVHPVIRTHPETGRKALYIGHPENVPHFEDMTVEESRPLVEYLYQHSQAPDTTYRHMWRKGDVLMWDNRCTMHYAVHDYGTQERELDRVTLRGEVPA